MNDDSRVIDKGWDAVPDFGNKSGDADDAVTVSISTTPGEWLVNTNDAVVVPMSMAEVVDALQRRKLTERSLVWRAGMQEWAPVEKVPQLKLAARMPIAPTPSVVPSVVPPRPTNSTKPPPKPVRPARGSTPPASPQALQSRRATLPFGSPTPPSPVGSRSTDAWPSSPRQAAPASLSSDEPEVLAVYARPTATISFDLSPEQPLRAVAAPSRPHATPQPLETLAPTTTDSAPRRIPPPRNADLSVVAASQFRDVQRSSKGLIWASSLGSAAAASLLTFWLARAPESRAPSNAASVELARAGPAAAPPAAPSVPSAAADALTASIVRAATPSTELTAPSNVVARPKPKPVPRKSKAVSVEPAPRAALSEDEASSSTRNPSAEPNPYDVKLDEEPPAPKPADDARSSGLDADGKGKAPNSSASPGF